MHKYTRQEWVKKYSIHISVMVVFCTLSFFLGKHQGVLTMRHFVHEFKPLRISSSEIKYSSPLIGVESPEATEVGLYTDLKSSIQEIIKDAKKKGKSESVSVYFRDLNTSLWFGVNQDETFYPASLLKLPYAFTGYKVLEDHPELVGKKYVYTKEIATINRVRPAASPSALGVGAGYTIEELIIFMIERSDNGARDMLALILPPEDVNTIFSMVGITVPDSTREYEMSTEKYSRFLRMLYSASYLNEINSNKLLTLLTKTDFDFMLTKELPKTVEVAHKWGVVNISPGTKGGITTQLHDCGIVYITDSPYVLCMMTKGKDQVELANTMAQISKTVFDYVTENNE